MWESQKHHCATQTRRFFETPLSAFIVGCGGLTACRARYIRAALSWCPVIAGNGDRAKLPENPANRGLSGQNGFIISGWAVVKKRKQLLLPKISEEGTPMDLALTPDHLRIQNVCRDLATDFASRAATHDRDASLPPKTTPHCDRPDYSGSRFPKNWAAGVPGCSVTRWRWKYWRRAAPPQPSVSICTVSLSLL